MSPLSKVLLGKYFLFDRFLTGATWCEIRVSENYTRNIKCPLPTAKIVHKQKNITFYYYPLNPQHQANILKESFVKSMPE